MSASIRGWRWFAVCTYPVIVRFPLPLAVLLASFTAGCFTGIGEEPLLEGDIGSSESLLTAAQRRVRAGQIRDAAADNGMTQGWMLAGIADAETNMSHCHSELTWACRGPNSVDCGGGPTVAGAGDGPCSLMQGGIGMFQFDAGTFSDTLRREGDRILTIAGNTAAAVDFVVAMVIRSAYVSGVDNRAQAIAWMNGVRVGGARWDAWIRTVTHYYNGCAPSYSCFSSRYAHYRDNTSGVYSEMGADFWAMASGGPDWEASFVAQTFPFARDPFELAGGAESAGHIDLRNDGAEPWRPGEVFLGTTEPRDVASPIAGSDWVSPSRAATVDAVTPPGEVGRFAFSVRGPATPGDYPQFFNLVREGVSWFSTPADDQLQVRVTVTMASCPAGTSARWSCDGNTRVRCMSSVEEEACEHGCLDDGMGAVCASAPVDSDGDGFFADTDCDDADATIFPGAEDPCGDGVDSNCDGTDSCTPGAGPDSGPGDVDAGTAGGGGGGPDRPMASGGCSVGTSSRAPWLAVFGALLLVRRRRR